MKSVIAYFLFLCGGSAAYAQTISISGTVKNSEGKPVPLAFVRDAQHYYATYADSTGVFFLLVDLASTLTVIAPDYADMTVKIGGKASIDIVMSKGVSSSAKTAVVIDVSNNLASLSAYLNKQTMVSQSGAGTSVKTGFTQEPTKGSPYLFT